MNPKVIEASAAFAVKSIAIQVNSMVNSSIQRHCDKPILKYLSFKVPRIFASYGEFDTTTLHYSVTLFVEVSDPLKPLFSISPLVHVHGEDLSVVLESMNVKIEEMIQKIDKVVEQAKESANKTIETIKALENL